MDIKLDAYSVELADRYAKACNHGDMEMVTLCEKNIVAHYMELLGYQMDFKTIKWIIKA